jgi:ABC-2 type transport system ATP-binding protein
LVVRVADGEEAVAGLVAAVGVPVKSVSVHRPTLDDVFLHFTGREIRGDQADAGERMKRAMSMYRGARR